jgi:hypothetical protein
MPAPYDLAQRLLYSALQQGLYAVPMTIEGQIKDFLYVHRGQRHCHVKRLTDALQTGRPLSSAHPVAC